jgi:cellulose synthase (UDP-forming)
MSARPIGTSPIGWARPTLPGRDLPIPETNRRRNAIRALSLVAIGVSAVYLVWRATSTLPLDAWWASIPLFVLEVHAFIGLALFAFSLWDVDRRPAIRDVTSTDERVAVLIPTYNEGIEVLTPTIAAAVAMTVPHETWVLDDGDRPDVARLAEALGARYLTRPEHAHAKAGNLNHALGIIDATLVAVLDADHVADPSFLTRTLGYFDDPRIAVVQTPQEFYNVESFEHEPGSGGPAAAGGDGDANQRFHEQALFYRVIQPGKNRWDAAFWCGTGAVVRVAALRDVGLVATDTITEDIHTTIRLHRRGWKTVYHNEILARGLAASDAGTYQAQRLRWGTGAMQVLRTENPMFVPGLRLGQRLAYAATLLGWFDAWRSLGYLLLPIVVMLTGVVPIRTDPTTFLVAFVLTFSLQQLALRALSRGCHRPVLSILFEFVRMAPNLAATLTLLRSGPAVFKVTPKGRVADARQAVAVPRPLTIVLILSFAGIAWYTFTLLGATPLRYEVPWAVHAAFGWSVLNVALIWMAIRRVRAPRYAAERRSSVRFATSMTGRLDGLDVRIHDLSLTGARTETTGIAAVGPNSRLVVDLPHGEAIGLEATVRTTWTGADGRTYAGIEFADGQFLARAEVARALFGLAAGARVDTTADVPGETDDTMEAPLEGTLPDTVRSAA